MKEETEKSSTKVEISEMRKIFKERLGTHTIDHIMLMGQDSTFH
jgi:serine/threonine protein kinase